MATRESTRSQHALEAKNMHNKYIYRHNCTLISKRKLLLNVDKWISQLSQIFTTNPPPKKKYYSVAFQREVLNFLFKLLTFSLILSMCSMCYCALVNFIFMSGKEISLNNTMQWGYITNFQYQVPQAAHGVSIHHRYLFKSTISNFFSVLNL